MNNENNSSVFQACSAAASIPVKEQIISACLLATHKAWYSQPKAISSILFARICIYFQRTLHASYRREFPRYKSWSRETERLGNLKPLISSSGALKEGWCNQFPQTMQLTVILGRPLLSVQLMMLRLFRKNISSWREDAQPFSSTRPHTRKRTAYHCSDELVLNGVGSLWTERMTVIFVVHIQRTRP